MKITKAVITAAGRNQPALPLQRLVDRDGRAKSALQIIVEETIAAGAEEIAVIVRPGDEPLFAAAVTGEKARLEFIPQARPRGYGHALDCARAFVGDDPFLHLVSDHLCVSHADQRCARQLVVVAEAESCAVSAVQATRENMLPYYGVVGGHRVPQRRHLYVVEALLEKPTPTEAEQRLLVPGLRAGHYLCFFGMHVLTPLVLDILAHQLEQTPSERTVQLTPALAELATRERYLGLEIEGSRYNIGLKYGFLTAQLALALDGEDREEVLAQLLELLASRKGTAA